MYYHRPCTNRRAKLRRGGRQPTKLCQALSNVKDLALHLAYALIRADNPQRRWHLSPMTTTAPQDSWQALRQAYEALATKGTDTQKQTAAPLKMPYKPVAMWAGMKEHIRGHYSPTLKPKPLQSNLHPTLTATLEKEKTDIIRARILNRNQ